MNLTKLHAAVLQGLCILAVAGTGPAFGALVFDRGLPSANLNNAAGADRSNVSWADLEPSSSPAEYWLPGDDFTLSGTDTYAVSTIRVWTVTDSASLKLMGGTGGAISLVSSSFTATKVTYSDATSYQGSGGSFSDLYQIDFNVSFNLTGGTQYEFFLDGPWTAYGGSDYRSNFLHASNKDKSGSLQQGADDFFKWYHVGGSSGPAVETWRSGPGGGGSTGWPGGWDKDSDANVQVIATVVPEPEAYALAFAGMAVVGLFGARRRRAA